ncbi:MAG: hypothetical protein KatS3mg057_3147 [Herpetosiphonaceae bacterium]|nr:MAG: hypothetical protein KatS3mg057_3147 [Herpetosiphonaceae bacterium]
MKRLSSIGWVIALVVLLIGCALLIPRGQGSIRPGSTHTTGSDGAAALERWLQELGYTTLRMEYRELELSAADDALFIITPQQEFSQAEVDEILRWVREDGGTLIIIDEDEHRLLDALDIEIDQTTELIGVAEVVQPLAHPPVEEIQLTYGFPLVTTRQDGAVLMRATGYPVLMAFAEGRGLIYVCACPNLPTNRGLRDEHNATLTLNLLNRVPQGGQIVFDEIHHGFRLANRPRPADPSPLTGAPLWRGLLYAALVAALFIVLTGRRFGKPVPLRAEVARRSSAEYVQSMAGLLERGRKTGYVLRHYKEQLKRRLAKPYGFNPRVSDDEFVRELARLQPIDTGRLADLLRRMSAQAPRSRHAPASRS